MREYAKDHSMEEEFELCTIESHDMDTDVHPEDSISMLHVVTKLDQRKTTFWS